MTPTQKEVGQQGTSSPISSLEKPADKTTTGQFFCCFSIFLSENTGSNESPIETEATREKRRGSRRQSQEPTNGKEGEPIQEVESSSLDEPTEVRNWEEDDDSQSDYDPEDSQDESIETSDSLEMDPSTSSDQDYEVETILKGKVLKEKVFYQVKWKGCPDTSWEPFKNFSGCKELLNEFHAQKKLTINAFSFSTFSKYENMKGIVAWINSSNSTTKAAQRKGIVGFVLTFLCQEHNLSLPQLFNRHPKLSEWLSNIEYSHKMWDYYKGIHENPQTRRNQASFMRDLVKSLITTEQEASITIRLNCVKSFWMEEHRHWSAKANYYRRTQRTKSFLQKNNKFLSREAFTQVSEDCVSRLTEFCEEGKVVYFFWLTRFLDSLTKRERFEFTQYLLNIQQVQEQQLVLRPASKVEAPQSQNPTAQSASDGMIGKPFIW